MTDNAVAKGLAEKAMSIDGLFTDFYVLESMILHAQKANVTNPRRKEVLISALTGSQNSVRNSLFFCLRDYFFAACLGESRHARSQSTHYLDNVPVGGPRHAVYALAHEYQPVTTLYILKDLFANCKWSGAYGGQAWANIASLALEMFQAKEPSKVLVDRAVDAVHNGGSALNKTGLWRFAESYDYMQSFLNFKRNHDVVKDMFSCDLHMSNAIERQTEYFESVTGIKIRSKIVGHDYLMQYRADTVTYGEEKPGVLISKAAMIQAPSVGVKGKAYTKRPA